MKVGVPKETKPGERRVALVPDSVKKLADAGFDVVVERGAGNEANLTDAEYEEAGATLGDASAVAGADAIVRVAAPSADETPGCGQGPGRLPVAAEQPRPGAPAGRRARHELRDGVDPAHDARPGDGRAFVTGRGRRIPRDARGRPLPRQVPADADHRGRHRQARPRAGAGRGRRGTAGDRHGQAPRRGGRGVRRAPRGQGRGGELGREVRPDRGAAGGRGLGLRRVRQGGLRGRAAPPAGAARRPRGRRGHPDHDRRRSRPPGAEARQRRDGACDEARFRDRRHGGRDGRQRRADPARAGGGRGRRHDRRDAQPPQPDALPREPAVREQRREPAQAPRAGGQPRARLRGRDHGRRRDHARRPDRQRTREGRNGAANPRADSPVGGS